MEPCTRGTINNCAHGVTPWNTYMTAEETGPATSRNTRRSKQKPALPREHRRYGVSTSRSRYGWELAAGGADEFVRFDAAKGADATRGLSQRANAFGWMVEIDPFKPDSTP
jgi:uncharacterized protein